nr:hypothetical protein Iba_chr02aCG18150 [Ipomoea batatas]
MQEYDNDFSGSNEGTEITSSIVCADGEEGAELWDGPVVFAVPELLVGFEDIGRFLFLRAWFFKEDPKIELNQKTNIKALRKFVTIHFTITMGWSEVVGRVEKEEAKGYAAEEVQIEVVLIPAYAKKY